MADDKEISPLKLREFGLATLRTELANQREIAQRLIADRQVLLDKAHYCDEELVRIRARCASLRAVIIELGDKPELLPDELAG